MKNPKTVIFLRSIPLAPDPRVEKEAKSLIKYGINIIAVGWDRSREFPEEESLEFGKIYRIRVYKQYRTKSKHFIQAFMRNLVGNVRWNLALLIWLMKNNKSYDYIHACDFDTIIPALACKLFFGKKVVYDIFDFYADMLRDAPDFLRRFIRRIDLFLIGFADGVIIADEGRIEQIKGSKPRNLVVIYNSPSSVNLREVPKRRDNSDSDSLVIAYIGLLQRERGIFEMIDVVKNHPEWKLVLGGYGAEEEEIKAKIKDIKNVKFIGRVPYDKTLEIYASSDIMFATYDPQIPNHRYSSANKLFEAMMLGKPIIVARNTSMDKIVEKYGLGFVVEYGNKKDLEETITSISNWDKDKWELFEKHAKKVYSENFSWETMEHRLITLYESLEK